MLAYNILYSNYFICNTKKKSKIRNIRPTSFNIRTVEKSLQSCPTRCDPIDGSPPSSPSLGFSRKEHWSTHSFSNAWKWKWSCVRPSATPWTAAFRALQSMGFSRQEYWSGVPLPSLNIRTNVAKIPILLASYAYSGLNQCRISNFKHCLSMPDTTDDLLNK